MTEGVGDVGADFLSLQRRISDMEDDFGKSRAKFKELYMAKENELAAERDKTAVLRGELDDALTRLAVAHVTFDNQLDMERRKQAEELASLHHLEKEHASVLLRQQLDRYQAEIRGMRQQLREATASHQQQPAPTAAAVNIGQQLTSVTRQLARKLVQAGSSVGGVVAGGVGVTAAEDGASSAGGAGVLDDTQSAEHRVSAETCYSESDTYGHSRIMQLPLQQETDALKHKLRSTDAQLQLQLLAREQLLRADQQLLEHVRADGGRQLQLLAEQLHERLLPATAAVTGTAGDGRCDAESAAGDDTAADGRDQHQLVSLMCMYTSLLETQKLALRDDLQYAKSSACELRSQLAQERHACRVTSDQLLETQRHHLAQTRRLRASLPRHLLQLLEVAPSTGSDGATAVPSAVAAAGVDDDNNAASQQSLAAHSDQCDSEASTVGGAVGDGGGESAGAGLGSSHSLDLLESASLGGASARTTDNQDAMSIQSLNLVSGQRVVSDKEWNLLWDEVSINKNLAARCEQCEAVEARCQHVDAQLRNSNKQRCHLQRALDRHQQQVAREIAYRKTTEQQWSTNADANEQKVLELYRAVETSEARFRQLSEQHGRFVCDIQDRLRRLTADKHTVQQQLNRLQADNDLLIGRHSATSAELQNEFINLPDNVTELHERLLRCREDLIAAKLARELAERRLSELATASQLKQQTAAEQNAATNARLAQDNDSLRERLALLQSVESELEAERVRGADFQRQLLDLTQQCEQRTAECLAVHEQMCAQNGAHDTHKNELQREIAHLKAKVSTLQQDLDNSETVQRDFVKLSQSLQVELEAIRQSETEVRWQHEEDVDACGRCRVRFSVSRRKHHCRHCGKIFCSDCVSQTVVSGSHALPSRVCQVCHTLLNRHSAPYFSNHAPTQAP